jgi:hypothetical protein
LLAQQRGGEVEIDVIDTGPGVPLEEREAIFDAFFRGRAVHPGGPKGTGLGPGDRARFRQGARRPHRGRAGFDRRSLPRPCCPCGRRPCSSGWHETCDRPVRIALRQAARPSSLTHRMPPQSAKSVSMAVETLRSAPEVQRERLSVGVRRPDVAGRTTRRGCAPGCARHAAAAATRWRAERRLC